MRIFFAASASPNDWALPRSTIWLDNLYRPLLDLGHDVVRFDYDFTPHVAFMDATDPAQQAAISLLRPRLCEELLRQVRRAHAAAPVDLFFSYFVSAYVTPEVLTEVRRMGIVTVNWFCNASYQFDLVREIAPAYDFCLVPEKFRLDDYRRAGANPLYCQEAANPNVYRPQNVPVEYDVTFVGQRYGNRPSYLKRLLAAGVDARAFGPRWDEHPGQKFDPTGKAPIAKLNPSALTGLDAELARRCAGPVSDGELVTLYSRSRISLGFSAVANLPKDGSPPIKQVRLRDFEAPMSGAFYLAEHFEELAEFYEPGKEIVFFHDADDLAEKARYYLRHEGERLRIRGAGMRRARAEHTWHNRFRSAFKQMGLNRAA